MFKTEKELVETLKINQFLILSATLKKINTSKFELLEELDLGHGIADLVFVEKNCLNLNSKRENPLNYSEISVFMIIKKYTEGITFKELLSKSRLSNQTLRRILNKLEFENFIETYNDLYIANSIEPISNETIAIEAKLKNWKRALQQAYRYKWFASYSYVFMDEKYIQPAMKNKDMFKSYNIGLASVGIKGEVKVLFKPQKIEPYDEAMKLLLAEKLQFGFQKCLPIT